MQVFDSKRIVNVIYCYYWLLNLLFKFNFSLSKGRLGLEFQCSLWKRSSASSGFSSWISSHRQPWMWLSSSWLALRVWPCDFVSLSSGQLWLVTEATLFPSARSSSGRRGPCFLSHLVFFTGSWWQKRSSFHITSVFLVICLIFFCDLLDKCPKRVLRACS